MKTESVLKLNCLLFILIPGVLLLGGCSDSSKPSFFEDINTPPPPDTQPLEGILLFDIVPFIAQSDLSSARYHSLRLNVYSEKIYPHTPVAVIGETTNSDGICTEFYGCRSPMIVGCMTSRAFYNTEFEVPGGVSTLSFQYKDLRDVYSLSVEDSVCTIVSIVSEFTRYVPGVSPRYDNPLLVDN